MGDLQGGVSFSSRMTSQSSIVQEPAMQMLMGSPDRHGTVFPPLRSKRRRGECQGFPLGPNHITIYGHKTVGMWTNEILIHAGQSVFWTVSFERVSFVRHEIISLL